MNTEEARAAAIEIWCDPDASHEEFERGIDAYALTVLKKALSEKDKPHPFVCADPERECWGKPPCWVHKLIQQIEELSGGTASA